MATLSINIDHIATLREARGGLEPDPVTAAHIAELAGASGIVCHLREDRRHINDRDVKLLRETIKTSLNLEMAATEEIIAIACDVLPDIVTLVPEKREERTTEGGLDVVHYQHYLKGVIQEFHKRGIPVSLFVEPNTEIIEMCASLGADVVELHTGIYANAQSREGEHDLLEQIREAAVAAKNLGLDVHAGHGLNYLNAAPVCAISAITDVSIGHAVISRALFTGLDRAVREMLEIVRGA